MTKKITCPYSYPHKSRAAKIKYITGIGGYGDRHEHWPIEFCVGLYHVDISLEKLKVSPALQDFDTSDPLYEEAMRRAFEEDNAYLYEWAVEDAARSLKDDDAYSMLWDGRSLDLQFELQGRGGKHLVITEFEGLTLSGMSGEDLFELLSLQERADSDPVYDRTRLHKGYSWEVSNETLDKLYRYCRQCEIDFTPEKASAEVMYQAAWHLALRTEDMLARMKLEAAEQNDVLSAATILYEALDPDDATLRLALDTLCQAAGVKPAIADSLSEGV